jgi:hypothetical protein
MTEVYNRETAREPETLGEVLEGRFGEAVSKRQAGIDGYIIEPKDSNTEFIRLHKDTETYDLMVGRPTDGSEAPENFAYWIITIRKKDFFKHADFDMMMQKDEPDRLYELVDEYNAGSPINPEKATELLDYIRAAQLVDRST